MSFTVYSAQRAYHLTYIERFDAFQVAEGYINREDDLEHCTYWINTVPEVEAFMAGKYLTYNDALDEAKAHEQHGTSAQTSERVHRGALAHQHVR